MREAHIYIRNLKKNKKITISRGGGCRLSTGESLPPARWLQATSHLAVGKDSPARLISARWRPVNSLLLNLYLINIGVYFA